MATWDDVDRIAAVLPETAADDGRAWRVHGKTFVRERPLRAKDRTELGDAAPAEAPVAFYVADEGEKEALLGDEPDTFFTTSHFDGYAIVLARLDRISVPELEELVQDAWLARAPKRLATQYLEQSE
jgi:hypothetical protein